jgi:hypothetical protein
MGNAKCYGLGVDRLSKASFPKGLVPKWCYWEVVEYLEGGA